MVYLIKWYGKMDPHESWLCGGALVTTTQILTSAACIVEIENIYAIAGYRKYVSGLDINKDNCTKLKKQKVVKIRVPREHIAHLREYKNTTTWMTLDIGVATVEKPYDFEDVTFRIHCSYIPAAIQINYNRNLEKKIGTSVVAFGWGRNRGSKNKDVVDRNSDTLREASLRINDKHHCIERFKGNKLTNMIEEYMICAHGKGMLDGEGFLIEDEDNNNYTKCIGPSKRTLGTNVSDKNCKMDHPLIPNDYLGAMRRTLKTRIQTPTKNQRSSNLASSSQSRLPGICQNDHGGPLITWVGKRELLIGVAVNSLYDENFECIGPYLFTSTAAAGLIVSCLLANDSARRSCLPEGNITFEILEKIVQHDGTPEEVQFRSGTIEDINVASEANLRFKNAENNYLPHDITSKNTDDFRARTTDYLDDANLTDVDEHLASIEVVTI